MTAILWIFGGLLALVALVLVYEVGRDTR